MLPIVRNRRVIVDHGRILGRIQGCQSPQLAYIGDGFPDRHAVIFKYIDCHTVAAALAVRREDGIFPVLRVDEKEVVVR